MLLDRQEVAQRICKGQAVFVYHAKVINATAWLRHHPGGALAILHFVGRDASNEVDAYHSPEAIKRLERFAIGTVEIDDRLGWSPLTPPISLGLVQHPSGVKGQWIREGAVTLGEDVLSGRPSTTTPQLEKGDPTDRSAPIRLLPEHLEPKSSAVDRQQEQLRSLAYQQLKIKLQKAGMFRRPGPLAGYGSDIVRYLLLGGLAFSLFFKTNGWAGQMASATFLGLMFHQLTFLAHDAGHTGVTGVWFWDRLIGMTVANWVGGLSLGWWCDNHNVHHLVTNHPEHDPDIQHIPFFAISKSFFGSLWSTYYKRVMGMDAFSKAMISVQHKLYYVVLSLARFNLYANSYGYLLGPKPKHDWFWRFELAGVAFYWCYFGAMLHSLPSWSMRLAYLLVSHIASSPVHVQITLSHFGCSTDDLGPLESFPSRQLRTTMDVACSPEIEFIHGGLHLQVTHHLFPRLPRHNLREASLLVKQYCREQEIIYQEHSFIEGNRQVLSVLEDVAKQLQFLKEVADSH